MFDPRRVLPLGAGFVFFAALLFGCDSDSTRPPSEFHLDPDTLDFGEVLLDVPDTLDFWIHNDTAENLPLRLELNSAEFSFATGTGDSEFTLPGSHSTNVTVICLATVPGLRGAVIVVEGKHRRTVTCLAKAESHGCVASTTLLDFGSLHVGQHLDKSFTLTNSGKRDLYGQIFGGIQELRIMDGGGAYVLAEGETREVTIRFEPSAVQDYSVVLDLGHEACDSLTITGRGLPPLPVPGD